MHKRICIVCILVLTVLASLSAGVQQDAIKQKSMIICFMHGEDAIISPGNTSAAFSEVKWGDSTLIVFPNGQTMLIDGGMANYAPILLRRLKTLGITELDYVVVSHRHDDHYGGLFSNDGVLQTMKVNTIISSGILNGNSSNPKKLETLAEEKNVEVVYMAKGDSFEVGGVTISALWPQQGLVFTTDETTLDVNNSSLVLKFEYKNNTALFPGDLYMGGEAELVNAYSSDVLDCDVLKVPHHGRPTSSSKDFVNAVSPKYAVALGSIVMEPNTYKNYARLGCSPYMDTFDGYVTLTLDGTNISIETTKKRVVEMFDKIDRTYKITH